MKLVAFFTVGGGLAIANDSWVLREPPVELCGIEQYCSKRTVLVVYEIDPQLPFHAVLGLPLRIFKGACGKIIKYCRDITEVAQQLYQPTKWFMALVQGHI